VEVRSTALAGPRAAAFFVLMLAGGVIGRLRKR
jgi:hypothetical protein